MVALLAEGVGRNLFFERGRVQANRVALLAEGVGRNITQVPGMYAASASPSSRRAWVEILQLHSGVDYFLVALLAEGVGRNVSSRKWRMEKLPVALLAEGVGRNSRSASTSTATRKSPSSRRAWVEICCLC